jgi:group I intron endonuclease
MKVTGIYQIKSKVHPLRIYIGSAVDIFKRKGIHLSLLRKGSHHNPKLQTHFNKHGESDLSFSIIMGCNKADLLMQEQNFINSLSPWFNILTVAGASPMLGRVFTDQHKRRISKSRTGILHSEESKKRISEGNKGKIVTKETRMKLSQSHRGEVQSRDRVRKRALANTGQKRSEETKRKIGLKSRAAWALKR